MLRKVILSNFFVELDSAELFKEFCRQILIEVMLSVLCWTTLGSASAEVPLALGYLFEDDFD